MQSVEAEPQSGAEDVCDAGGCGRGVRPWGPRRGWHYLLQLVSLGAFFLGGMVVTLVVTPVVMWRRRPDGRDLVAQMFRTYVGWLAYARLFEVKYEGIEELGSLRGTVIASNHPGLLDAVFLIACLPRPVCIMRAGLMGNLAFAGSARMAGYITNDQGPGLIRRCREVLRSGDNLLFFPEGTRTRSYARGVNRFKPGFALAAVVAGAPVRTILIERSGSYLSKERGLLEPAEIPIRMTIRAGQEFRVRQGETAKALAARMEEYFRAELGAERPAAVALA